MNKEYFLQELKNHIRYMDDSGREQDKIAEEMESKTSEIIHKKESDGKLDIEDFVFLEKKSFKTNVIQLDLVRVASRIRLLFQIGESEGWDVESMLPVEQRMILKSTIDLDNDFSFMKKGERMVYKNEEMNGMIDSSARLRVKEEDLENRYASLKEQFDRFSEMIKNQRNAEGDSRAPEGDKK